MQSRRSKAHKLALITELILIWIFMHLNAYCTQTRTHSRTANGLIVISAVAIQHCVDVVLHCVTGRLFCYAV